MNNAEFIRTKTQIAAAGEETDPIISGILDKKDLFLIFGEEKSGKSIIAISMAKAIADPRINEWAGHKVIRHRPVLYCGFDDKDKTLATRFADQMTNDQFQFMASLDYHVGLAQIGTHSTGIQAFAEFLTEYTLRAAFLPEVVFIDTLAKVKRPTDPAYNQELPELEVFRNNAFFRNTGITFVCITHSTKTTNTYLGSRAIGAEIDRICALSASGEQITLDIRSNAYPREELTIQVTDPVSCRIKKAQIINNKIDDDIKRVLQFVARGKRTEDRRFEGTVGELCYAAGCECSRVSLGKLLSSNKELILQEGFSFTKKHTENGTKILIEVAKEPEEKNDESN